MSWCDEPLFEHDGVILHFFVRDRVIGQGLRKVVGGQLAERCGQIRTGGDKSCLVWFLGVLLRCRTIGGQEQTGAYFLHIWFGS